MGNEVDARVYLRALSIAALVSGLAVAASYTSGTSASANEEPVAKAGGYGTVCPDIGGGITAAVAPHRASVRPGEIARFRVAVTNERHWCPIDSTFIWTCVKLRPGNGRGDLQLPDCPTRKTTVRPLAYGATKRVRLPVKARKDARGRYRLRFRIFEATEFAPTFQDRVGAILRVKS